MPDTPVERLLATQAEVARAVSVAAGREPADLLLRNARVINVITRETITASISIAGRLIAGVGTCYNDAEATVTIDLDGAHVSPGLIDGHLHVESSLVTPAAYAEAVVPRGVTGIVWDPHEIANVAGTAGIYWCIQSAAGLPFSVWIDVPSCVPSTTLETSGAEITVADIANLLGHPAVVGVGELMSYEALIEGNPDALSRAYLGQLHRTAVDGHAPGVTGRRAQAYLASGVGSDHECTELAEAHEKLRAGAFLMIREGSATRNLGTLLPLLRAEHADRIGFVTDDRLPADLLRDGGVDFLVRTAIAGGVAPELAIRAASWNTARYFSLNRRGAVAPGYFADLIVLRDIATFSARSVYHNGVLVAENGALVQPAAPPAVDTSALDAVRHSVHTPRLNASHLSIPGTEGEMVRCIRPVPEQILTTEERIPATVCNGEVVADPQRDIAKLVCVERHGRNGNVGVALVTGLGLRSGAIAGTVAHDHHNIMAVGISDQDILTAVDRLGSIGGGFVVVENSTVVAELALPIAGLLSEAGISSVAAAMHTLDAAARALGITLPAPFMTLSFLGLPVIPELRLTDLGLVDVNASTVVPVAVEKR